MDIQKAIKEKESLLEKAKETVRVLENQIEALRSVLSPSALEVALKSLTDASSAAVQENIINSDSVKSKNTRSHVKNAVLEILSDGTGKSIDEVFEQALLRKIPTTRRSIGSTLNRLKLMGVLETEGYGKYKLPVNNNVSLFTSEDTAEKDNNVGDLV